MRVVKVAGYKMQEHQGRRVGVGGETQRSPQKLHTSRAGCKGHKGAKTGCGRLARALESWGSQHWVRDVIGTNQALGCRLVPELNQPAPLLIPIFCPLLASPKFLWPRSIPQENATVDVLERNSP